MSSSFNPTIFPIAVWAERQYSQPFALATTTEISSRSLPQAVAQRLVEVEVSLQCGGGTGEYAHEIRNHFHLGLNCIKQSLRFTCGALRINCYDACHYSSP